MVVRKPIAPRKIARYGWRKDIPSPHDKYYAIPGLSGIAPVVLPPSVDLRANMPPVYDQGQLGSCTANAIAGALQFDEILEHPTSAPTPSRLFIYYNERVIEGDVNTDGGAQLRDGVSSVASLGYPPETEWPYVTSQYTVKPTDQVYADALQTKLITYLRVTQVPYHMKHCLFSGYPWVFGFTVYESFESQAVANTGVVPMPAPGEATVGGHAVLCVGYDDSKSMYIVRNSWGSGWGQQGYFEIPYAYLEDPNLASDLWTLQRV